MALGWFFFAAVTGLIYGSVELFDKFVFDQEVSSAAVSAFFNKIPNFLVFTMAGLTQADIAFSPQIFAVGLLLSVLYLVSSYFYYIGIGQEDVSRFIPTLSISTVFVILLSFLVLGEKFGLTDYIGMFLTVAGAILISVEKPARGIHVFQSRKAIAVGVLAALLWAFRDVLLKIGTSTVDIFHLLFWIGLNGLIVSILASGSIYTRMEEKTLRGYEHLLLIGSMVAVGYLTFIKSISTGPVSLASVVVKIDAAIVFLGSVFLSKFHPGIIHEELERRVLIQKILSILMIIGGIGVIHLL